ncbi:MAG: DUF2336 domain-containing protein [Rhizomicrobium sp.]|jgi:hypothetical protein
MSNARERLTHLVELASAPEKQPALATELCDLLIDWPADYSSAMRAPFEALLEKVAREIDGPTRRRLATRLAAYAETPLDLLNEFFFDLPLESRNAILARNDEAGDGSIAPAPAPEVEAGLVETLRRSDRDHFAAALGTFLGIDAMTAAQILDDHSAGALAVACRGAHLERATFSALALLANGRTFDTLESRYARLGAIDGIPKAGAEALLDFWRARRDVVTARESDVQAA